MSQSRASFVRLTALGALGLQEAFATRALGDTLSALRFDFRSAFWENLHHRLYFQAQAFKAYQESGRPDPSKGRWYALAATAIDEYRQLGSSQRPVWERAMQVYIDRGYADANLHEDLMPSVDAALTEVANTSQPSHNEALPPQLVDALTSAAPIYRSSLWEADDTANRKWISMVAPLVAVHTAALTARLKDWYQSPWPVGPYRVDVTSYADVPGFYTNTDPIHTIATPRALRNSSTLALVPNTGMTSLEMIFHEASHTVVTPGYGTIGAAIEDAAAELGKPEPKGLWHAVIFYTAGRAVLGEVRGSGKSYTTIADALDLYSDNWASYRNALVEHWQPYLEGRGSLAASLKLVVVAASLQA